MQAEETSPLERWSPKQRDRGFVIFLAVALAAMAVGVVGGGTQGPRARVTSSGTIRAVAPSVLREQLGTGRMSRHRAAYWRRWRRGAAAPDPRGKGERAR